MGLPGQFHEARQIILRVQVGGDFDGIQPRLLGEIHRPAQNFIRWGGLKVMERTDHWDAYGTRFLHRALHLRGAAQFQVDERGEIQQGLDHRRASNRVFRTMPAFRWMPRREEQRQRIACQLGTQLRRRDLQLVQAQFRHIAQVRTCSGVERGEVLQCGGIGHHSDRQWAG